MHASVQHLSMRCKGLGCNSAFCELHYAQLSLCRLANSAARCTLYSVRCTHAAHAMSLQHACKKDSLDFR